MLGETQICPNNCTVYMYLLCAPVCLCMQNMTQAQQAEVTEHHALISVRFLNNTLGGLVSDKHIHQTKVCFTTLLQKLH